MKVVIRECKADAEEWVYRPRADDEQEAIDRTVKHFWGSRAFFHHDQSLDGGVFGQIFKSITGSGEIFTASSLTDRISIQTYGPLATDDF